MAIRYDQYDNSLIVEGFENGISDDPFDGIADLKNVNIISVPGEASVNFSTESLTSPTLTTISVLSADAGADTITFTGASTLEARMAITFSASSIGGVNTGTTIYWVGAVTGGNTCTLYSDYSQTSLVDISSNGTGTFYTYNIGGATSQSTVQGGKYFAFDPFNDDYYMVDSLGQVWSNRFVTTSGYWTYTGNVVPNVNYTAGNGLAYYRSSGGNGYLFVFHNSSIDYVLINTAFSWQYQWSPSAGTVGGYSATPSAVLNTGVGQPISHEALVGQDNVVYYCDLNFLGSFFEKDGQNFSPTNTATYTFNSQALKLPVVDNANCLAELGVNLLIGGQRNVIYPWDRTSTSFTYPIFLAESVIAKMQTVNTNTFIFCGNRGRIYVTNGSQAQLYKKIPDHISGTVEPYYQWGGVCSGKNQLFFSMKVTTNSGTAVSAYGGVWAIDMNTKAIRLTNKLSYNTYLGFATALIAEIPALINPSNAAGTGFFAGWDSGASTYGIDGTASTPYTGSQAQVDSDLIPIGTYDLPRDFTRVEYRLTKPMVSGESITLKYRLDFSEAYTTILTDSTAGNFSLSGAVNFKNAQWLQLQAILNSTASSPSYTRLKEFRIKGVSGLKKNG